MFSQNPMEKVLELVHRTWAKILVFNSILSWEGMIVHFNSQLCRNWNHLGRESQ